jgi:hypothetical protein
MILPKAIGTPLCTVMLTGSQGQGDKKLDANVRQQLASSFLFPLTVRTGPLYITAQTE